MSPTINAESVQTNHSSRPRWPSLGLGLGFGLGLLVGVGMLIGSWLTLSAGGGAWWSGSTNGIPEIPLRATATDSADTFAICTGPVSEGVEGIFTLDFLTGDIQCWVFDCRRNVIGGYFKHNVIVDLGMDQSRKNTRYLMVTGETGLRGGGSAVRYSECVVYVADATSGNLVGYAVPWNRTLAARAPQQGALLPVFKQAARNLEIRGQ